MTEKELEEMQERLAVLNKDVRELNEGLKRHFEAAGVKNAYYYEPLHEIYWKSPDKIAICNIESYDKGADGKGGILPVTYDVMERWHRSKTFDGTEKFCQLLSKMFESGFSKGVKKSDIKKIDGEYPGESLESITSFFFYLNLRLTVSEHVDASEAELSAFYSDEFCRDYFKNLMKAAKVNALVVSGEIGCHTINKIYPDLQLGFRRYKVHEGILFFSIDHPSRASHELIAESANEFIDAYCAMKNGKM